MDTNTQPLEFSFLIDESGLSGLAETANGLGLLRFPFIPQMYEGFALGEVCKPPWGLAVADFYS